MNKENLPLTNRLYNAQLVEQKNGRWNAHMVVGSNRPLGGYNYEMNLLETYKEMVNKWKAAGVVVTTKYLRHPNGLTFKTQEEAFNALVEMEAKLVG